MTRLVTLSIKLNQKGWARRSRRCIQKTNNKYYFIRQIEKAWVESQPIVTNEATLQLTIPALIKSSTKDLKLKSLRDEKRYTQKG